jgi:hypothetical protein
MDVNEWLPECRKVIDAQLLLQKLESLGELTSRHM